jgi:hypothetical protein
VPEQLGDQHDVRAGAQHVGGERVAQDVGRQVVQVDRGTQVGDEFVDGAHGQPLAVPVEEQRGQVLAPGSARRACLYSARVPRSSALAGTVRGLPPSWPLPARTMTLPVRAVVGTSSTSSATSSAARTPA